MFCSHFLAFFVRCYNLAKGSKVKGFDMGSERTASGTSVQSSMFSTPESTFNCVSRKTMVTVQTILASLHAQCSQKWVQKY